MGYNLKTPWDLGELKKEGIPVFSPIVGSSSFVDLKLGRFGDPGEGFKVARMDPSPSRKPRARGNGVQAASCLVDGCRSDLSTCRDYHRRHKVCEVHSKTAVVTIGGQERRFCQQCSRFHSLVEFDEGKRSCRKRLDGHNRRRRKPQPEAITLNPARFLSNHQGTRYIPFGNPQVCGTGSVVGGSGWAGVGVIKAENDPILYNSTSTHSLISFADQKNGVLSHNAYEGGKQFSFLQGTASAAFPGDCTSQAFLDPNGGSSSQKMFGRAINSDRALSLLSSPPSKTREFGFGNVVQTSSSQLSNSVISTSYNNLRPLDTQAAGNVMGGNLHSHGMAMSGIDESSPHQTLYFSWE